MLSVQILNGAVSIICHADFQASIYTSFAGLIRVYNLGPHVEVKSGGEINLTE